MDKKYRALLPLIILLCLGIANYSQNPSSSTIRTVDFLKIWAIGAVSGLLIYKVVELIRKK